MIIFINKYVNIASLDRRVVNVGNLLGASTYRLF